MDEDNVVPYIQQTNTITNHSDLALRLGIGAVINNNRHPTLAFPF